MRISDWRSDVCSCDFRGCYSLAIAVFGLSGVRQARVAGAQFEFQRPFAHRKAPLNLVHPRLLCRIEVQLVMQEGVEFVFDRCRRGYERAADKRAGDSGEKCDDSYQQKPATVGHLLAPSSVEGASAGGAPNGAREEARASRPGIAEVARDRKSTRLN